MNSTLRRVVGGAAVLLAATLAHIPAMAQEAASAVASVNDWTVFVDAAKKECWGVSKPKETVNTKDGKPASVRRGDIMLFVTFRSGKSGEIAFTGGYPFAPGSTVTVDVDGRKTELFTDGEWAWTGSPEDDAKLIAVLKAGSKAVLSARSAKGTQTRDTFSLMGFTAAMDDAAKRCK